MTTERRCPHHVGGLMPEGKWRCFDCGELLGCKPAESHHVAPESGGAASDGKEVHGLDGVSAFQPGATSCDSEELAMCRKAIPFLHHDARPIAEALLSMVDELTASNNKLGDDWLKVSAALVKERDELRAKLAEAEETIFSLEAGVRDLEIERREERERAEAAEAVAEERRDRAKKAELAKEAAEARIRELTCETCGKIGCTD